MTADESGLRTTGEVVRDGWQLFQRAFVRVFPLALLAQWVALLPVLASPPADSLSALEQSSGMPSFLVWLVVTFIQMFFLGVIINEIRAIAEGAAQGSLAASVKQGVRLAFPLFLATVVFWVGVSIGMAFLIIPGFILGAYLVFYPYTVVLDRRGPIEALGASFTLVDGNFWRAGILLSVPTLGYLIVYAIIYVRFTERLIEMLQAGTLSLGNLNALGGPRWFEFGLVPVLLALSATLLWTMAYPIFTDLKQRKAVLGR